MMGVGRVTACRSCRASIVWVTLPSGKSAPLDAVAVETADPRAVLYTLEGRRVVPDSPGAAAVGHLSHFATCPDAKAWSGKGKDAKP